MHVLYEPSYSFMYSFSGLIPGPFQTPVFDDLRYRNMERGSLGDLITCVDVRWTDGRHTGGGAEP